MEKSVFDVYKDAEVDLNWTEKLKDTCKKAGITFFTSPYSMDLVDEGSICSGLQNWIW